MEKFTVKDKTNNNWCCYYVFLFLNNFVVLFSVFVDVGLIDIAEGTTGSGSSNYSYISSSTSYWWPIGSNETTSVGGALFAGGDPVDTVITSYFGGRIHPITGEKVIILVRILLLTVGLI